MMRPTYVLLKVTSDYTLIPHADGGVELVAESANLAEMARVTRDLADARGTERLLAAIYGGPAGGEGLT